jgi:hypothetical protein
MNTDPDTIFISGLYLQRQITSDFGIPEQKLGYDVQRAVIEFLKNSGASVYDNSYHHSTTMLLANPLGYYSINVKKSTWTILGFILDLLVTSGATTATLGALGIIGQCIGKLNEESGEVCVYTELARNKDGQTPRELHASMSSYCKTHEFECRYKRKTHLNISKSGRERRSKAASSKKAGCSISLDGVREILTRLKEIGAVTQSQEKKWKVEL